MDIKKPLLVKVEAFIYAFVYSCVGSSATPSFKVKIILDNLRIQRVDYYDLLNLYLYFLFLLLQTLIRIH